MKVTKYPQSTILIEKEGKRLVIDPGSFFADKFQPAELGRLDGILITHEHSDHMHADTIRGLKEMNPSMPVVGNESTKKALSRLITNIMVDQEELEIEDFRVTAVEIPHVAMPDGSAGPQNTGYMIDGIFFHPGDGIKVDGLTAQAAAIPIVGPDISPRDVFDFIKALRCRTVIPIHYDKLIADPQVYAEMAAQFVPEIDFRILEDGQSAEIG